MQQHGVPATAMQRADEDIALSALAPAGHYIALRIGFAFPMTERNDLPDAWVEYYTQQGLMVHDPVVRWAYGHTGARRWSELGLPDPRRVLADARRHGLRYGLVVACAEDGPDCFRSFATFARRDREFTDDEIAVLQHYVQGLHNARATVPAVTDAELEALGLVRDGFLAKEIAVRLGVSEGAVKQRLRNVRQKLGAKTGSQAVSIALRKGLI